MGLDVSHDAFRGAYSAFNRLRQCVCKALGEEHSFPPHYVYLERGIVLQDKDGFCVCHPDKKEEFMYIPDDLKRDKPGLYEFLVHSDCDGEISPELCVNVANDLEQLLPRVKALNWEAYGHIAAYGGYAETLQLFIDGCRSAASANEPLRFY